MPDPISLNGEWSLRWLEESPAVTEDFLIELEKMPAITAQVPGNVELDLQRARIIPEPYYADNIRQLRTLENREWWYVKHFQTPVEYAGKPSELIFAGLDTLATIWLNGQPIGQAENMLIPHRFEVTAALHPGEENTLAVRLKSTLTAARQEQYEPGMLSWEHRNEGLRLRKAPHVWGWDILPRATSAGIWRPVTLQLISEHAIEKLYVWTVAAQPNQASLGVWFSVRTTANTQDLSLVIRGECGGHSFQFEWPLEFTTDQFTIPIDNPRLWWPTGYGKPNLYTLTARLYRKSQLLAECSQRTGLRKLELRRTEGPATGWHGEPAEILPARIDQPMAADSHFYFRVNGQPILVKGTNWVPLDAFHSRDADRLPQALAMVADLGCNMIRCWGGNVYESDAFFDWCDAHGVMVWQDFAFACCIYPQDEDFLKVVQEEIQAIAERLRNHASLVVWCGDNEVDMVYASQGRDPQHNRLTRQVIPQILQRFDPHRDYLPSSPYISAQVIDHSPGDTAEQHLWGPRGYFKGDFYTRHTAHFIGEIGYHGCPVTASIAKFISPNNLWPPDANDEWQVHSVYHWRSRVIPRDRVALMENQIRAFFGRVPANLADFAFASQAVQAEALKFFIESTRLRKWHTSGILWWNLLDGWPQFSDAVVDYYYEKKLAYHFIRRVQQPILLCLGEKVNDPLTSHPILPVALCNDGLEDTVVLYRIWDAEEQQILAEGEFTSPANQNWQIAVITAPASVPHLFLLEWRVNNEWSGNHYLLAEPPVDLGRYRIWIEQIAALPQPFKLNAF